MAPLLLPLYLPSVTKGREPAPIAVRNELVEDARLVFVVVHPETDQPIRGAHLIRDFFCVEPRIRNRDGGRDAVGQERVQGEVVVRLPAPRPVEPDSVPDDAAAKGPPVAVA